MKKIVKICNGDKIRADTFDTYYGSRHQKYPMTCQEILRLHSSKDVCQSSYHLRPSDLENYNELVDFLYSYTKENIAHVKIYIKDPYYVLTKKDVQYNFASFIGTTGGLVGLCFGLSFISIVEIIYFILRFAFRPMTKHCS